MTHLNEAPINPLPAVTWALALPMIAMEVVLNAGASGIVGGPAAIGWRVQAMQDFAFAPDYLRQMISFQQYPLDGLYRPFTYSFVHPDVTQAVFVIVILLALGKFVGEVFQWWAVLLVFFASSAVAALAYTAIPFTHGPLIGGYPAVYGLIGAFTYVNWMLQAGQGAQRLRAFRLIGFLLGIRIIFGAVSLMTYGVAQGASWDWTAEFAGFVTGFGLSFLVSPGGWRRLLGRLRQR
ncbi:rhomboid family intramembrane serine protease [bacterium]|nr:rhomboid family intramembrane serine protease [bacterium]